MTAVLPSACERGEVTRLVLEPASADDVELRVFAHRTLGQPGERRAFQLGQVLAGEECDEVRCGVDGLAVDPVHQARWLPRRRGATDVTTDHPA